MEMSSNIKYFTQPPSFETLQPTIQQNSINNQSSDESPLDALLQVTRGENLSPDSENKLFNISPKNYESKQSLSYENTSLEVDLQPTENVEFDEKEFQILVHDFESQLTSTAFNNLENIGNTPHMRNSDFQVIAQNCENINENLISKNRLHHNYSKNNLTNLPQTYQYNESQQNSQICKNSISLETNLVNSNKYGTSSSISLHSSYQNQEKPIQNIPTLNSSSELDTKVDWELIDKLLESKE